MDAFDKWQSISTFALAVIPWFFADLEIIWKFITLLLILLISSILYSFRLHKKTAKLSNQLDEVKGKHKALVGRYDRKRNLLTRYQTGFVSVEYLIGIATQSTKQGRLETLWANFLDLKIKLEDNK